MIENADLKKISKQYCVPSAHRPEKWDSKKKKKKTAFQTDTHTTGIHKTQSELGFVI